MFVGLLLKVKQNSRFIIPSAFFLRQKIVVLGTFFAVLIALLPASSARANVISLALVSVANDGTRGNESSFWSDISDDGNYVAFFGLAKNLTPGMPVPHEGFSVHLYNRQTGVLEPLLAPNGELHDSSTYDPSLSFDGRYMSFESWATNLVEGDSPMLDIFVYDQVSNVYELITVATDGTLPNDLSWDSNISSDGRYVVYQSYATTLVLGDDTNSALDIFLRDRELGTTELISVAGDGTQANGFSREAKVSADGRYVVFASDASNLVPGDTNGVRDIFLRDRELGTTELISVAGDGTQGDRNSSAAVITPDGRYIAFVSAATNLVPNDTNDAGGPADDDMFGDVFIYDQMTDSLERVNVAYDGTQANAEVPLNDPAITISADGRYIAFGSTATNLVAGPIGSYGLFIKDRETGRVDLLTQPDGQVMNNGAFHPAMSADGLHISFTSWSTNLVQGTSGEYSDIYVVERAIPIHTYFPTYEQILTTENAADWPNFSFEYKHNADWFNVWVGTQTNTNLYMWYPAFDDSPFSGPGQGICNAETSICTLPDDIWMSNGPHSLWLSYWVDGDSMEVVNTRWEETPFTVDFGAPTTVVDIDVSFDESGPTSVNWLHDESVHWYQVWVGSADYSVTLFFDWINATDPATCMAGTCTLDVSDMAFSDGPYEVWVEKWGPGGYINFADVTNAPYTFQVGGS